MMKIRKAMADRAYQDFKRNDESYSFFEYLISKGVEHVELIWHDNKPTVKAMFYDELVEYEFEPYDITF